MFDWVATPLAERKRSDAAGTARIGLVRNKTGGIITRMIKIYVYAVREFYGGKAIR